MLMELELTPEHVRGKQFYYGKGCNNCNGTGYRGRTGLYEIMVFNDELRDLVMNQASTAVLRDAARRAGMQTLRDNGLKAMFDGITTLEEVVRETIVAEEE
jgi:type IV pilus assembly protein PilB